MFSASQLITSRCSQLSNHKNESTNPIKVLMVEDDSWYFEFVRALLAKNRIASFEPTLVRSISDCIKFLSTSRPDVILLDLGLPDGDGMETVTVVVEAAQSVPVIVLTGRDDDAEGLQALKLGAQDYLLKRDVASNALIRVMCYCIERQRAQESSIRLAAIENFVATLAHDLKVPMVGSKDVLDALLSEGFGAISETQERALRSLREAINSELSVLERLLEIYRYESGHPNLNLRLWEASSLVADTIASFNANLGAQRVVRKSTEATYLVRADRTALNRVLTNLLDNAIKFGDATQPIEVSLEVQSDSLAINVHNFGEPLPEGMINGLFQRFWQGEPGKSYVAHTGLGLYLCHRIASVHHGRITCSSTASGGNTVGLILPLWKDAE